MTIFFLFSKKLCSVILVGLVLALFCLLAIFSIHKIRCYYIDSNILQATFSPMFQNYYVQMLP